MVLGEVASWAHPLGNDWSTRMWRCRPTSCDDAPPRAPNRLWMSQG